MSCVAASVRYVDAKRDIRGGIYSSYAGEGRYCSVCGRGETGAEVWRRGGGVMQCNARTQLQYVQIVTIHGLQYRTAQTLHCGRLGKQAFNKNCGWLQT